MNEPIRILELRSVRGTGGGPEKTILLGAARSDPTRFAVTVCYLRDARDDVFSIDDKAATLPIDYVEIVEKHSFDPSIWDKLRRLIRGRRIDIVHAHDYKTNLLAWLLAHRERVTALSTVHGWTGRSQRERWVYYPCDKRVLARFPKLIAVSSEIGRELVRCGARPDRVVTVLNGIDHRTFRRDRSRQPSIRRALGLSQADVVIGAVGRIEVQKRFDLLIDAFAELRTKHSKLVLLIAGDGSQRDALRRQASRLGVDETCRFLGQRSDLVDLHHVFDLFVQSSDYEGTPNAVLEAMALETPVVATDVGGTSELMRNRIDGFIIPPGNRAALVEAIAAALEAPGAAASFADEARRRVETTLSFETRMAAVEDVYTELHQQRRAIGTAPAIRARA
jgi:glycosyltransferase involved in cell wall biosynthesis